MEVELNQLELRYEKLRRRNARKERQVLASLADNGQQLPVLVVCNTAAGPWVLVDGYKRVRALRSLRRDVVAATTWELGEIEAVVLERLMRTSEPDGALEQGWLLEELNERFGLSHDELAQRFDKSQSWVSRRLALVRALPREVQARVQSGALPAHAAMKFLVPMARANLTDSVRLVSALGQTKPSTRDVGALYATWVSGDDKTRELVVTQPLVVLRAREQAAEGQSSTEQTAARTILHDLGILIGVSRRARGRIMQGALAHLLPTEQEGARCAAQQARWECEALFRAAQSLLSAPDPSAARPQSILAPPVAVPAAKESAHA
jgi:ParB family chromosome partitioning protein